MIEKQSRRSAFCKLARVLEIVIVFPSRLLAGKPQLKIWQFMTMDPRSFMWTKTSGIVWAIKEMRSASTLLEPLEPKTWLVRK